MSEADRRVPSPEAPPAVEDGDRYQVRSMQSHDATAIAHLHRSGIPTGVLAEIGVEALADIYVTLVSGDDGFVYVGVDDRGRVVGFVSGVTDVSKLYRRVVRRHFLRFALLGLRNVFHPRMIRRLCSALLYPARVQTKYPPAELLSIVIDPAARGSGLGTQLLEALRADFRRRGISEIKVMVRADFERANAYYRKHGFALAGQTTSHGHPANIYTLAT